MASAPFARSSWLSRAAASAARFRGARTAENLLEVRLRAGDEREVAFREDPAAMQFVAGGDPGQGANRHLVLGGHASAPPSLAIQPAEERKGRAAHAAGLGGARGQAAAPKPAIA